MARAPAAGAATAISSVSTAKQNGKSKTKAALKPGELSKAQRKKAAKKAKKAAHASWCWYCDREFQDDKVLLSHQKAKHFRCPHCPRRLNTAGGLAVHIDQVHKVPVDRLENTLPGRDSFDIEIYGMEGIPKDDLLAWRKKRDEELGNKTVQQSKRPKVFKGVISIDDLAKQLAVHRSLMRNSELGGAGLRVAGAPIPLPPGMLPGGIPLPPPGLFPLPPNMLPVPPPGFGSPMAGGTPGMPGLPVPPGLVAPQAGMPVPASAPAQPPYTAPSSRLELKTGQVLVYGDNDVSIEEKRAKNPKYASASSSAPAGPALVPAAAAAPVQPAVPAQAAESTAKPESMQEDVPAQLAGQKRARAADFI